MSDRGNAEFYEMKGFLSDLSVKQEGHVEETMPPDPGTDVTEGAEVDNADINAPKAANIKASDNKPASTSTTMDKEVGDIPEKAEGDIADGYVSDVQHLPGPGDREKKGFEQYNEMVAKGVAVDSQGLNKWNIDAAVDAIVETANKEFNGTMDTQFGGWMRDDLSVKGFDSSMVVKMESNVAPEDEEANEGLTEDSEGVGSTEEETDADKGKQGENQGTPQTGGENDSFSEEGAEEEKGARKALRSAVDYARGFRKMGRSGAKMQTGKDYVESAKKVGKWAKKNKKVLAMGAAGGAASGAATGALSSPKGQKGKGALRGALAGGAVGPLGGAVAGIPAGYLARKKKRDR